MKALSPELTAGMQMHREHGSRARWTGRGSGPWELAGKPPRAGDEARRQGPVVTACSLLGRCTSQNTSVTSDHKWTLGHGPTAETVKSSGLLL